jgi:hypothetical protein
MATPSTLLTPVDEKLWRGARLPIYLLAQAIISDSTRCCGSGFVVLGLAGATLIKAMTVGSAAQPLPFDEKGMKAR